MSIKLFIADDQQILRESLTVLLSQQPDLTVVGSAATGYDTVRQALKVVPDIILMDVNMPDLNGIEATRQILEQLPSVKVIGLSGYDTKSLVINMLNTGAKGYVLKDCGCRELIEAIHAVMKGEVYLSPHIASIVVEEYRHLRVASEEETTRSILTPRERGILMLLAEGHSMREIVSKICIDRKTVEAHRRHIIREFAGIR